MRDKKEKRKDLEKQCAALEKQRRSQLDDAENGCGAAQSDIKVIDKQIKKLIQKIKETY